MEKQYSVQFFTSLVDNLQRLCQDTLFFSQFVEVSGYVCVEIDNMKKERYVLSELLQSSGNVVSESYCTKVSRTVPNLVHPNQSQSFLQTSNGMKRHSNECMTQRNLPRRSLSTQYMNIPSDRQSSYQFQSRRSSTESDVNFAEQSGLSSRDAFPGLSDPKQPRIGNHSNIHQFNIQKHQTQLSSPRTTGGQRSSTLGRGTIFESSAEQKPLYSPVSKQSHMHSTSDQSQQLFSSQSDNNVIPVQLFKHKDARTTSQDSLLETSQDDSSSKSLHSVVDEVIDLDLIEDDLDLQIDYDSFQGGETDSHPDIDLQQKKSQLRPGTQIMVKNSVNQFKRFIYDKYQQDIDLLQCQPEKLNMLLLEYFKEAKKVGGGELRARSLKCVQERLMLFLKEGNYPYSLIKDKEFMSSREYLKKRLLDEGRVVSHIHSPVDDNDIEILFQAGQLGSHSLDILTNTMWFLNTKYFNIRGPAYHLDLKWGDIVLRTSEQGEDFLERSLTDAVSLKVFSNPTDPSRCFVNLYKQFAALRPKMALDDGYSFYLKHARSSGQDVAYLPEPMVYYQLTTIWRKMVAACGLPGNKKIM